MASSSFSPMTRLAARTAGAKGPVGVGTRSLSFFLGATVFSAAFSGARASVVSMASGASLFSNTASVVAGVFHAGSLFQDEPPLYCMLADLARLILTAFAVRYRPSAAEAGGRLYAAAGLSTSSNEANAFDGLGLSAS